MAQTTLDNEQDKSILDTSGPPLPDVFSAELMRLIERVKPGIVQVRNEGRGAGTGIIWHSDGTIVTNHHVVPDDEPTIQVHLSDNRVLEAKVIDRNPKLDLAVLKVTADNLVDLPAGVSSRLRVGELVFAIGHPWGQRWVVTAGIVSGVGTLQAVEDAKTPQHIKSDVRIAPGYSGGPLLDAQGNVVGINAMIFGGDLAVSIPSDVVSNWIGIARRQIDLNIEVLPVEIPASLRKGIAAKRESGLLVVATNFNGASEQTDMFIGDVLLDLDNKPVDDVTSLVEGLARFDPEARVRFQVIRGGNIIMVEVPMQSLERISA
ncbi:MAG TPA: trypsin-like peptidase domain-containing protein [Ktedonobacteraceae bacterium]|nr:trypsin-like peptidase domain-containing protein [Ktedonobacteraceae bacterium]